MQNTINYKVNYEFDNIEDSIKEFHVNLNKFLQENKNVKNSSKVNYLKSLKNRTIFYLTPSSRLIGVVDILKFYNECKPELIYNNNVTHSIFNYLNSLKKEIKNNFASYNFKIYFNVSEIEDPIIKGSYLYNLLIEHKIITMPNNIESNVYGIYNSNNPFEVILFTDLNNTKFYLENISEDSNPNNIIKYKVDSNESFQKINYVKELMKKNIEIYVLNMEGEVTKKNYSLLFQHVEAIIYKNNDELFIENLKKFLTTMKINSIAENPFFNIIFLVDKNENPQDKGNKILNLLIKNKLLKDINVIKKRKAEEQLINLLEKFPELKKQYIKSEKLINLNSKNNKKVI